MATKEQINKFIPAMAVCAQTAYKKLGKVRPSVAIGMACCECAYGTSGSVRFHSYFGHKVGTGKTATNYWGGKFFVAKTMEEYAMGVHTPIKAAFRAYDSMQQCTLNFYELLNTSLYSKVTQDADYKTQMRQIKECGYMTSSTEVNTVIRIIETYNLTKYDSIITLPRMLKQGMTGEDVKILQEALNKAQRSGLVVDGIFGPKTDSAVKDFQAREGLEVDGIVGPITRAALKI